MSNDENRKQASQIAGFVKRLYGDVSAMSDEEVNEWHTVVAPDVDAAEKIRNIAVRVARKYRLNNEQVPPQVQGVLNATKPGVEGASISKLRQVIQQAITPLYGPASQVSYAYRNKKELTDQDLKLLDECSEEVKRDWTEDKS
ncbi:MAG: hypothetical protein WBV94_04980 [Blastocatellia bacterium]